MFQGLFQLKRWLRLGIMLAVVLAVQAYSPVKAQSADNLTLNMQGDLWSLASDGTLKQLTTWGFNHQLAMSSDGKQVAYLSTAHIFVDWAKANSGGGGYQPPDNVWILDTESGETFRVVDQPADAKWNGVNTPGKYTLRTQPSWSPDSQQLAWAEITLDTPHATNDLNGSKAQLMVWDAQKQKTDSLASDLSCASVNELYLTVKWGRPGIAMFTGDCSSMVVEPFDEELRVYDGSGNLISNQALTATYSMASMDWLRVDKRDYLFEKPEDKTWLNWQTAEIEPSEDTPEMYSLTAPGGATFSQRNGHLIVTFSGQAAIDLGDKIDSYTISRDGQQVAYTYQSNEVGGILKESKIVVQSAAQKVEFGPYKRLEQIVWGPVAWRVHPVK